MTRRERVIEALQMLAEEPPTSSPVKLEASDYTKAAELCSKASQFLPEARPDEEPTDGERISDMLGAHVYNRDDFPDIEHITAVYYVLITELSC